MRLATTTRGLLAGGCLALVAAASAPPALSEQVDRPVAASTRFATKVLVVIEENHSYTQMRTQMPYLAGLSRAYGYATQWRAVTHPSEPNYLAIAGGSTFGITDDKPPSAHRARLASATSVFDQALSKGRTAATYAESMPTSCDRQNYPSRGGSTQYAVRHNPWSYFPHGRTQCRAHDVALTRFASDAAADRLPNVGFLIPNLDHDAHDGSLATADTWLRHTLASVLSSSDFAEHRLVVVVTADEDDRRSGNLVLTSVLTPALSHKVVHTPLTHYSLTRFLDQVIGARPLRRARTAPDLAAAFGLRA